jgi:hypothetical protein
MKKICIILSLLMVCLWAGNLTAQDGLTVDISWSDYKTAILDSINGAKYVLAGVDVDKDGKQEIILPISPYLKMLGMMITNWHGNIPIPMNLPESLLCQRLAIWTATATWKS